MRFCSRPEHPAPFDPHLNVSKRTQIQINPPFVITPDEIDQVVTVLGQAIGAVLGEEQPA